jgi:hypothetical protein
MADGDVFDAHRLIRTGPDAWRSSYLGSATTLERAQALALANYKRLRASIGNFEQEVRAQRCDQGPVVVLTRRPQRGRQFVELAAEPIGSTQHAQIPDADRDSVGPVQD